MERTRLRELTRSIFVFFHSSLFVVEMERTRLRELTHLPPIPRIYHLFRRNGAYPIKGIDTYIVIKTLLLFIIVEMERTRLRELTHHCHHHFRYHFLQ